MITQVWPTTVRTLVLIFAALLFSSQLAFAQFTQQGPKGRQRRGCALLARFIPETLSVTATAESPCSVPLPRWLMPVAACFEGSDGSKFVFDIDTAFRLIGPVVHRLAVAKRGGVMAPRVDPVPF
jgi:hypothetical protein